MSLQLIIALVILGIIVVGAPVAYVLILLRNLRRHRKEVQGKILVSYFDRVTNDEEIVLCDVIDKYKVVPPSGSPKKQASKEFPHGYYLHYGAVKDQAVLDDKGNQTGSYSGSIVTKAFWPIGKKPETQAQVNHAYYNKGDPRPLNPFNSFLPVNTDVAVQVLADENALTTLLQHMKYEFESIFKMLDDVKSTAKYQKYIFYALLGVGLLSLISMILGIIAMKKG